MEAAVPEGNVAVYLVVHRSHVDVYAGEHAHTCEAGVSGVDFPLVIKLTGAQHVQVFEYRLPYPELFGTRYGNVPYRVFTMLLGRFRKVSQGIVPYLHLEPGLAVSGQGVCFKGIETLGEAVVTLGPEILGGTKCFLLEGIFRQVLSFLERSVGKIFLEIFLEGAVRGDFVIYSAYLISFPKGDVICDVHLLAPDVHLAFHL